MSSTTTRYFGTENEDQVPSFVVNFYKEGTHSPWNYQKYGDVKEILNGFWVYYVETNEMDKKKVRPAVVINNEYAKTEQQSNPNLSKKIRLRYYEKDDGKNTYNFTLQDIQGRDFLLDKIRKKRPPVFEFDFYGTPKPKDIVEEHNDNIEQKNKKQSTNQIIQQSGNTQLDNAQLGNQIIQQSVNTQLNAQLGNKIITQFNAHLDNAQSDDQTNASTQARIALDGILSNLISLTPDDYLPKKGATYECKVGKERKVGIEEPNFRILFLPTSQTTSTTQLTQTTSSSSKQSVDSSAMVPLYESIIQDLNGQEDKKLKQAFVGAIGIEFIFLMKTPTKKQSQHNEKDVEEYDILVDPVNNCVFNQKAIRTFVKLNQQKREQTKQKQQQTQRQNLMVRFSLTESGGIGIQIFKEGKNKK